MSDVAYPPPVDLDELQKYLDNERDKQARAEAAQHQAARDRLLEEIEARRQASAAEEALARAAADPNNRVAEWLYAELGDRWPSFVTMMGGASLAKVAAAVNRIEGERAAGMKHRELVAASVIRADESASVDAERKARVESQLSATRRRAELDQGAL